jgi:hypothetical protein
MLFRLSLRALRRPAVSDIDREAREERAVLTSFDLSDHRFTQQRVAALGNKRVEQPITTMASSSW